MARRIAWLGFSVASMASIAWIVSTAVSEALVARQLGLDQRLVAEDLEAQRPVLAARAGDPGEHDRRADVAAHGVDRDARAGVHLDAPLVRVAAQASVETISRPL